MLLDSPRLTHGDRAAWARLETYDARLATDPALPRMAAAAVREVAAFAAAGDCYMSTSWGKDSTVAAHLACTAVPDLRLVWVRSRHFEMPECDQVRDAFLTLHPYARYEEIEVDLRNPKRGEPGYDAHHANPDADHQDVLKETLTGRYITGLRAEESVVRRMSIGHRGLSTPNTCRPIGHWQATHVFAYLHRVGLPVHPAYAMSISGALDRQRLRVHPLCSAPPVAAAIRGAAEWEDLYYLDVIAAARAARAHRWVT